MEQTLSKVYQPIIKYYRDKNNTPFLKTFLKTYELPELLAKEFDKNAFVALNFLQSFGKINEENIVNAEKSLKKRIPSSFSPDVEEFLQTSLLPSFMIKRIQKIYLENLHKDLSLSFLKRILKISDFIDNGTNDVTFKDFEFQEYRCLYIEDNYIYLSMCLELGDDILKRTLDDLYPSQLYNLNTSIFYLPFSECSKTHDVYKYIINNLKNFTLKNEQEILIPRISCCLNKRDTALLLPKIAFNVFKNTELSFSFTKEYVEQKEIVCLHDFLIYAVKANKVFSKNKIPMNIIFMLIDEE